MYHVKKYYNLEKVILKRYNFHASKEPIDVNDDDIEHIAASNGYPISISFIIQIIPMTI